MHKKLMASAVTGFLLLGAAGVAMAQTTPSFPPLVVYGLETSGAGVNIDALPGDPCLDALQDLRAAGLRRQEVNVLQQSFIVFVMTREGVRRGAAVLVCAPDGTEPPPEPTPS